MYWARPWVLQRLADLGLGREHFECEADHLDGSTAHALERFVGILTTASGLDQVETDDVPSRLHRARKRKDGRPRALAFYLPQYHRVDENDEWWGEGFTDWVKVGAAEPLYDGHAQPAEPAELGYYDLSNPGVMRAQGALAREYGVDGFVMYHYWFDGKPLLDTPLRNLIADPTIDFPFALCWANENWTRRWDGLDKDVLIEQRYLDGWVDRFYDDLVPALRDERYIRVNGKPLLMVYRIGHVKKARQAVERWKQRAEADGFGGLTVLAVTPSRDFEALPGDVAGVLDGLVRFPPGSGIGLQSVKALAGGAVDGSGDIYSYDAAVDGADFGTSGPHGLPVYPGVMPGWDNTPRRGRDAYVFHGANPMSFRRWLARAADGARQMQGDPLLFINAWNEWAEGAHLEPDGRFGRGNLEAVRDLLGPGRPGEVVTLPALVRAVPKRSSGARALGRVGQ
jgi:lipopolysaccharide biosynthesis protein